MRAVRERHLNSGRPQHARDIVVFFVAVLPQVVELNIGHFLIGESVFEGLAETVKFMRAAMDRGRAAGEASA